MSGWAIGYVANAGFESKAPAEVVSTLAKLGYDAVDWTLEHFDPLTEGPDVLSELVSLSGQAGLSTPQLMVHQDFVRVDEQLYERAVRRTELAIEACGVAGIPTIGVVTGPNLWEPGHAQIGTDISEARAWDLSLAAMSRVLRSAESAGVKVSLEPCWGTLASDRYRAEYAISRLDCAALALTLDPSHFVMTADDLVALTQAWGEKIAHVHLKDAFGRPGLEGEDFTFLVPGAGQVPWPALLDTLSRVGYRGAMSVEFEAFSLLDGPLRGDPVAAARLARQLVGGLLAEAS
jgi:sugar phosphate isomerase/epimerase